MANDPDSHLTQTIPPKLMNEVCHGQGRKHQPEARCISNL